MCYQIPSPSHACIDFIQLVEQFLMLGVIGGMQWLCDTLIRLTQEIGVWVRMKDIVNQTRTKENLR